MALRFFRSKKELPEEHYIPRHDDSQHVPGMNPGAGHDDEGNWLVSYADMMTLLCGFFILLFSMSKVDQPQYEKVKESVARTFKGEYRNENQEIAKDLAHLVHEAGVDKEAQVRVDSAGVSVIFKSTAFFETLSSDIKPEGQKVLTQLMIGIETRQKLENKKYKVIVEGHTDSRPVLGGAYPSNWELSGARASQVVRKFIDRGFAPNHLVAIGYADTMPEIQDRAPSSADGKPLTAEEVLAKNRRVVIRILDGKSDYIPLPISVNTAVETANFSPLPSVVPIKELAADVKAIETDPVSVPVPVASVAPVEVATPIVIPERYPAQESPIASSPVTNQTPAPLPSASSTP
jgi:chemotaxis protein MotB